MIRNLGLAALLLTTACCRQGPVDEDVKKVEMTTTTDSIRADGNELSDNLCGSHDEMERFVKQQGFNESDIDVGPGIETYVNGAGEQMQLLHDVDHDCLMAR